MAPMPTKLRSLTVDNNNNSSSSPCSIDDETQVAAPASISPLSDENLSPGAAAIQDTGESPSNSSMCESRKSANERRNRRSPTAMDDLPSPNGNTRDVLRAEIRKQRQDKAKSPPQRLTSTDKASPPKDCQATTRVTDPNDTRSPYHPISITLDLLDGLGSLVESLLSTTCGHLFIGIYHDGEDDDNTLCSYERDQLLDDIDRFERMNSFDTFGTMNTAGTINTYTTIGTNDTGSTTEVSVVCADTVDDDGNVIPAGVIKDHLIRKQVADKLNESSNAEIKDGDGSPSQVIATRDKEGNKELKKKKKRKKKKRRKKVVAFEYPPISRMKEVPRISSMEKKNLFFAENEMNRDSFSGSDDDESSDDEPMKSEVIMSTPTSIISPGRGGGGDEGGKVTSSLRKGKFTKQEVVEPDVQNGISNSNAIVVDKPTGGLIKIGGICGRRLRRNKVDSLDEVPPILTSSTKSSMSGD